MSTGPKMLVQHRTRHSGVRHLRNCWRAPAGRCRGQLHWALLAAILPAPYAMRPLRIPCFSMPTGRRHQCDRRVMTTKRWSSPAAEPGDFADIAPTLDAHSTRWRPFNLSARRAQGRAQSRSGTLAAARYAGIRPGRTALDGTVMAHPPGRGLRGIHEDEPRNFCPRFTGPRAGSSNSPRSGNDWWWRSGTRPTGAGTARLPRARPRGAR